MVQNTTGAFIMLKYYLLLEKRLSSIRQLFTAERTERRIKQFFAAERAELNFRIVIRFSS